jgi:hypothetical protein
MESEPTEKSVTLTPAATATVAAIAAATATTPRAPLCFRTSFIDRERTAIQLFAVKGGNGAFTFRVIRHFNECEALRSTGIPISYDTGAIDGSVCFKHRSYGIVCRPEIEVSNKNILHLSFL